MKYLSIIISILLAFQISVIAYGSDNNGGKVTYYTDNEMRVVNNTNNTDSLYASDYFTQYEIIVDSNRTGYVTTIAKVVLKDGYNKFSVNIDLIDETTGKCVGNFYDSYNNEHRNISTDFAAKSGVKYHVDITFKALSANNSTLETKTLTSTSIVCK